MSLKKSPVEELVEGVDAIGTILDETLPTIRTQIEELVERQIETSNHVTELRSLQKELLEKQGDIQRRLHDAELKQDETSGTINALFRRLEQIQKSILELAEQVEKVTGGDELSDTVKMLEDRVRKIEGRPGEGGPFQKRF
jgi:chromosome segregation ATPase